MQKSPRTITVIVLISIIYLLFSDIGYTQELPIVTDIQIKGQRRIEEKAVRMKISQKVSEVISTQKISNDIKTIYQMGYFQDVKVEMENFEGGVRLIYFVKEKPTLVKIEFYGNEKIEDSKLKEIINISPGIIINIALINDNVIKLRSFYEGEGYYLARIIPIIKTISDEDVSLIFQINEGEKVEIKKIIINGNKKISTKKIKGVMKTSKRNFFSFITGSGYYKKMEMELDVDRIKDLYYDNGYLQISVVETSVELSKDKQFLTITISISEGQQFKISTVGIAGNNKFSTTLLTELIKITPKEIFNKSKIRTDISSIMAYYMDRGFAVVTVIPNVAIDEEKKEVSVTYIVQEGGEYKIGRIDITGNTITKDKVIRREMQIDEGDLFNVLKIRKSYERLRNLNFFETVDIKQKPNFEQKTVNFDVNVKDKPTRFINIGGGYSSVDKFVAIANLTLANLFGAGYSTRISFELGKTISNYNIVFQDPWFLDKPISFGINIYRNQKNFIEYERKIIGGSISFGKEFSDNWFGSIAYTLEEETMFNLSPIASQTIIDASGKKLTSSISPTITKDTRDYYLDPSRGARNSLQLTFAGIGGNTGFLKSVVDSSWYFPSSVLQGSTIHIRGRAGFATGLFDKTLPLYERFYIGGLDTIRGFDYGMAGPKDSNNIGIGGERILILNTEYIFPLLPDIKFKGVVFFDTGRAYMKSDPVGKDIKYSAGAGIRWISPIGPLRIEWGRNLNPKGGEPASRTDFAFGQPF